jgi:putative DNA primase/helicase
MARPVLAEEIFSDVLTQPVTNVVQMMRDPARPPFISRADLTEVRFTEQFAEANGDWLRYDRMRRQWMIYSPSSGIWQADNMGEVMRALITFTRQLQASSIQDVPDPQARRDVLNFYLKMERRQGIENAEVLARSIEPFACSGEQWDTGRHLLGTRDGILNLSCPDLPPIKDPALHVTRTIDCIYDPDARCVRWATFLDEVFLGNLELIEWIQKAIGYSLTGWTKEQVLFLLHGVGSNGKSLFLGTLADMLGGYAWNVPFSLFEQRGRTSINDDVAAIVGRRFITASETADRVKLNEPRVKMLTGEDRVTARPLYGKYFEFIPHAKFWLSTNHLPAVRDRSHGFWRRVRIVPFLAQFDGSTRDNGLRDVLRSEASGILLWALDGCRRWSLEGLGEPPSLVNAATEQFRADSDPLADFLEDYCVLHDSAKVGAGELLDAYREWADRNHLASSDRLTRNQFTSLLVGKFEKKTTSTGKSWVGVGMRATR